jgi:hypothetical protein
MRPIPLIIALSRDRDHPFSSRRLLSERPEGFINRCSFSGRK